MNAYNEKCNNSNVKPVSTCKILEDRTAVMSKTASANTFEKTQHKCKSSVKTRSIKAK